MLTRWAGNRIRGLGCGSRLWWMGRTGRRLVSGMIYDVGGCPLAPESRLVGIITTFACDVMGLTLPPDVTDAVLPHIPNVVRAARRVAYQPGTQHRADIADAIVAHVMNGQPIPINQTRWTWPDTKSTLAYRFEFLLQFPPVARKLGIGLSSYWG